MQHDASGLCVPTGAPSGKLHKSWWLQSLEGPGLFARWKLLLPGRVVPELCTKVPFLCTFQAKCHAMLCLHSPGASLIVMRSHHSPANARASSTSPRRAASSWQVSVLSHAEIYHFASVLTWIHESGMQQRVERCMRFLFWDCLTVWI